MTRVVAQTPRRSYDVIVIGAGFYGCALAEHLARQGKSVLVCEMGAMPLERASAVNQARVHTGFHYPRSFATALRSWHNFERFTRDYNEAVIRDFQMLYAIARYRTKVNARRFSGMFQAIGAPLRVASPAQKALFTPDLVEDVFACTEYAFDYTVMRRLLMERLAALPVTFAYRSKVTRVERRQEDVLAIRLENEPDIEAVQVFNVTYSQINAVLKSSGLERLPLKHELVEIALVKPPSELEGLAVTMMDGAFFSAMPYPAAQAYSLTHVRYTPHMTWTDEDDVPTPYDIAASVPHRTRWRHMMNDARRYMPALGQVTWQSSLFDVKTIPIRNERDDGRPILLQAHTELPGFHSVLGSKIDNIYDLFDAID
ncbi:FAD-dependent oxidoreductase [Lichenihabitans sp. Uapishka_5]|uniref:FAD-dependent oxidoreductase n=1 Tax=Lichenihabitans sp. Uapishka_5 TaxID=3037302 RepID=UPI0029E82141|nr:FAD-dependent oxidoreductase [Lichenihabitans sp. Uapishka_5]MDX7952950.1 FAD-dependent oxidoreductase [Lichenihabitans sp. Uapishka_5]